MRLTNICALVALVWLAAGTAAGLLAQAELFSPGLSMGTASDAAVIAQKSRFIAAILFHGCLLQVSLPLAAGLAMGLALLGEHRHWFALSVAAALVLVISAAVPAVMATVLMQAGRYTLGVSFSGSPVIVLAAGLAGLAVAGLAVPEARIQIFPLGIMGTLPLGIAGLMEVIIANAGGDGAVDETYFKLAQDHACGLTLLIWSFAVMLAWAGRGKPAGRALPALAIAFLALLAGAYLVFAEARLGLSGMPRHYIDYSDGFFPLQRFASWAGFALAFSVAAGAGFLAFLKFRPTRQVPSAFG